MDQSNKYDPVIIQEEFFKLFKLINKADDTNDDLKEYLKNLQYQLFDLVNSKGYNIFHKAAEKRKKQKLQILLEHAKASLNDNRLFNEHLNEESSDELGFNILHIAVSSGNMDIIRYLIS